MQQFSKAKMQFQKCNNLALLEEDENEETDTYSEDQVDEGVTLMNPAARTQQLWKQHNSSLTKRGLLLEQHAIEECAQEEDVLSVSNKENSVKKGRKHAMPNQTMTNGFLPPNTHVSDLPPCLHDASPIPIKIQTDARIKKHLLPHEPTSENSLNLLFYDFNSKQRQGGDAYVCATAQG